MLPLIRWTVTHIAPVFIVTSPVTSYADQIYSIHRNRSSAGFSLDIPLIMLVASILKIFYWLTARFETSLLIQAAIMIVVQVLLLNVSLQYRNFSTSNSGAQRDLHKPFASAQDTDPSLGRPYNFWRWRSMRPYWISVAYYIVALVALQLLLGWSSWFSVLQGYIALGVEATLPLPQVLANEKARSCKGFRLSVLVNWLLGDAMKMMYFFLAPSPIPWAFKLCGLFQSACDAYLGVQYWKFEAGKSGVTLQGGVAKEDSAELSEKWIPAKDPRYR
ncbi:MAG: hypothetical protein M1822_005444 [Bathelium mastoideum]|nr:MAG: hypothetical protein M1822_005444 [Bathelium mastoideum]